VAGVCGWEGPAHHLEFTGLSPSRLCPAVRAWGPVLLSPGPHTVEDGARRPMTLDKGSVRTMKVCPLPL
jgi:hypothetical protein